MSIDCGIICILQVLTFRHNIRQRLNKPGPSKDPCRTPNDAYEKVKMSVLTCTKWKQGNDFNASSTIKILL